MNRRSVLLTWLLFDLSRTHINIQAVRATVHQSPKTGACLRVQFQTLISQWTGQGMESEVLHIKARSEVYPCSDIKRFPVPDSKVPWSVAFAEYKPVKYTSKKVLEEPPWADKENISNGKKPEWNKMDGDINRCSFLGEYLLDPVSKVPRNPKGRTGISGRGLLGRWGPNHAADPIVTRWKVNKAGKPEKDSKGKNILQFIAIQRRDSNMWAIPGGMVDGGEVVTDTLKREFGEEALNTMQAPEAEKQKILANVDELFKNGIEVYRGYVDDPRNTDNAWMETVAMYFHDENGTGVAQVNLQAGDDAVGVKWLDLSQKLQLYANHKDFLQKVAFRLDASW